MTGCSPAVAWEGFYYVADEQTGTVHVFDGAGLPAEKIDIKAKGGPLELEVRESYLFINAPDAVHRPGGRRQAPGPGRRQVRRRRPRR